MYYAVKYEDINRAPFDLAEKVYQFVDIPFLAKTREWIKGNTGREPKRRRRRATYSKFISNFKIIKKDEYPGRDFQFFRL